MHLGRIRFWRIPLVCGLLAAAGITVQAERLPVRYYTTDDGLPNSRIVRIVRDSQGFLWFCTADGLGRFDGQRFTIFRLEKGHASAFNDFLETGSGDYWVSTNGHGACRFNYSLRTPPSGKRPESLFTFYPVGGSGPSNFVNTLYEDREGRIWAGTDGGLFSLDAARGEQSFVPVPLNITSHPDIFVQVWAIAQDAEGSLWIGTKYGLAPRLVDGRIVHYPVRPQPEGTDVVRSLLIDAVGRVWIGHLAGLAVVKPLSAAANGDKQPLWQKVTRKRPASNSGAVEIELPTEAGEALWLQSPSVYCVRQTSDGKVYVGTSGDYLMEFDRRRLRRYSTAQGLSKDIRTIAEDQDGNLWLGTPTGAMRFSPTGAIKYGEADGLKSPAIYNIFEDRAGNLYLWGEGWWLYRLHGSGFISARFNLPTHVTEATGARDVITDREGEWWVGTLVGLFRFPKVSRVEELATARPLALYTTRDGLATNDVRKLFEDSRGDIWIGDFAPDREVVTRWERATGVFHRYSDADGLPPLKRVMSFSEDASGNVWMVFWGGGLARYKAGRFTMFTSRDGIGDYPFASLHLDYARRLWVSTPDGLYRVDQMDAERPQFLEYRGDLESGRAFTGDSRGRLYITTRRGLAKFDPERQRLSYTQAEASALGELACAYRDRQGNLWFGRYNGLSKLTPAPDRETVPPPIFISAITIGGVSYPVSVFGQREVPSIEVGPGQNQVQIEFSGLSFSGPLRYQYRIEGLDSDWSQPTDQQTFYANLKPGTYRFLVRAVASDGAVSTEPASFPFVILPPIWQRAWFTAIALTATAMLVYLLYRYRVSRLLEIERVRARIATDLHDDIGSSLSQISVLSKVVQRRAGRDPGVSEPLSMIGDLSRGLVDSMSDIVWAINPERDRLSDLVHRMRRFASDLLTAQGIAFQFLTPDRDMRLEAGVRRELFLVFKESVTNIARHSDCTEANIALLVEHGLLELRVSDNGKGFDPSSASGGTGLTSMRQRPIKMGGSLDVVSGNGKGTTVRLRAPVR